MHIRMPAPIVQAHTGGIGPKGKSIVVETNVDKLNEEMQRERGEPDDKHQPEGKEQEDHQQSQEREQPQQPQGAGDPDDHQPRGQEQEDHHHSPEREQQQPQLQGAGEEKSCITSRQLRMPGPKVQASQGGLSPSRTPVILENNPTNFKRLREPKLVLDKRKEEEEGQGADQGQEDQPHDGRGEPVGGEEGGMPRPRDETYQEFLRYCEERRRAWKEQEDTDKGRMRMQAMKMEHWALLREARRILIEKADGWKERRNGETKRIKEREKKERLEIVAEKKRRYGL